MTHFQTISRITCLCMVLALSIGQFACKNDTPEENAEATDAPPVVERVGPIIPIEVLNQAGESISMIRVFETLTEGNGTVYQFRPGHGKIAFEPGISYKFRADGYADLDFEFLEIQDVDSITFYLNSTGNEKNNLMVKGSVINKDGSPMADVAVTLSETKLIKTDSEGRFSLSDIPASEATSTPLALSWKDAKGTDKKVVINFKGVLSDTINVDFTVNTNPSAQGAAN